ncbi:hypothetical protein AN220_03485, partial [Streptomyces nanshensis]
TGGGRTHGLGTRARAYGRTGLRGTARGSADTDPGTGPRVSPTGFRAAGASRREGRRGGRPGIVATGRRAGDPFSGSGSGSGTRQRAPGSGRFRVLSGGAGGAVSVSGR